MAGFVKELISRNDAVNFVSRSLNFPWQFSPELLSLEKAYGRFTQNNYLSPEDHPPHPRSLRDGYAVKASDLAGASGSSPAFLQEIGEVPMGALPDLSVELLQAATIHTGGFLPEGSDSVVMLEDTSRAEDWVEIRRSVQTGENVLCQGEEMTRGEIAIESGSRLDYRSIGILATLGVETIPVINPKIGLFSTGDEIVEVGTHPLPPGKIRDVNNWMLNSLLTEKGFNSRRLGILPDSQEALSSSLRTALESFDVILISGGSSVSVRDFTFGILSELPAPGLLIRGINIAPGKPTLIGGCLKEKKLIIGLPGHPLSCSVVALTLVLPILYMMCGITNSTSHTRPGWALLAEDVIGRSGIEEFIPARMCEGTVFPLMAKSGYVGALKGADILIRLDASTETARKGESVQFWPL